MKNRKAIEQKTSPPLILVKSVNNLVPNYGSSSEFYNEEEIKHIEPEKISRQGYMNTKRNQFVNNSFGHLQLNKSKQQQQQNNITPIINKKDPEIASLQNQILCAQQTQQLQPITHDDEAFNTLELLDIRRGTADFGNSLGTMRSEQDSIKSGQISKQFLSLSSQMYQNRQSFGGSEYFESSKNNSPEKKSKFYKEVIDDQIQEQPALTQSFENEQVQNNINHQSIRTYNQSYKRQSKEYISSLYDLAVQFKKNIEEQQEQYQDEVQQNYQINQEEENSSNHQYHDNNQLLNQEDLMNEGLIIQTPQIELDDITQQDNNMSQDQKVSNIQQSIQQNVPFNYSSMLHQGFLTNSRQGQSPSLIVDQHEMDVKNDSLWSQGEILLDSNNNNSNNNNNRVGEKRAVQNNLNIIQQTMLMEHSQRSFDHDKKVENILHKELKPEEHQFLMNDSSVAKEFSSVQQDDSEQIIYKKSRTLKDEKSSRKQLTVQQIKKLCHYQELQRENKKLIDSLVVKKEDNFSLQKRVREQNKDISKLNIQIIELTRKNQDMNFRLQESKKYHMKQSDELESVNHQNQRLKTQIKLLTQQNTHLKSKVQSTEENLQRETKLLRALLSFLERSEGQSSNYNTVMRTLQNKFEQIIAKNTFNQAKNILEQEKVLYDNSNFQQTSPISKTPKIKKQVPNFSRTLTPPPPSQSRPTSTLLSNFINSKTFDKKQGYPSNLQSLRSFNQSKLLKNSSYIKSKENLNHTHGEFWRNIMNKVVQRPATSVESYQNINQEQLQHTSRSIKQNQEVRYNPIVQKSVESKKIQKKSTDKKKRATNKDFKQNNSINNDSPSDIGGTMLTDRSEKDLGNFASSFFKQETGFQQSLGNQSARNAKLQDHFQLIPPSSSRTNDRFYSQISQKSPQVSSRISRTDNKKLSNKMNSLASTSGKKRKENYSDFSQTESMQSGEFNKSQSSNGALKESSTQFHKAKLLEKNLKDCLKSMIIKGKSQGGPLLRNQQIAPKSSRTHYKKGFF